MTSEIPQSGTKLLILYVMGKYFTYVLKSQAKGLVYVGSTQNVDKRIFLHNKGKVRSTKAYRPWQLLEIHSFDTRSEAVRHELFLKQHQQKEKLKHKYQTI